MLNFRNILRKLSILFIFDYGFVFTVYLHISEFTEVRKVTINMLTVLNTHPTGIFSYS